jgi:hypothetical protein
MRLEKLQITDKFFGALSKEERDTVHVARGFGGGFG